VRSYDRTGALKRILRVQRPPRRLTPAEAEQWHRQRSERLERRSGAPSRPEFQELYDYQTLPEFLPAHARLLVDRSNNLWVEEYRAFPQEDTVTKWRVFGPSGAVVAIAELPNAEITDVSPDRVVTVWRDEDHVPYVRVYRLVRK